MRESAPQRDQERVNPVGFGGSVVDEDLVFRTTLMLATIARTNRRRFWCLMMTSMSLRSRLDRSSVAKFALFTPGNALLLSSLFVFTVGLLSSEVFPRDPFTQSDVCKNDQKPAAADSPFDRVIFSLIDAPRLDSVYGGPSGLGFTQKA
jgi:hypothetical protein